MCRKHISYFFVGVLGILLSCAYTPKAPYVEKNSATGTFTDSRDGKTYKTVTIGSQIWMAENLKYEVYDSFCYDNDESKCKYGRFYSLSSARNKQLCPDGWHLPSYEEWEILSDAVGGKEVASKKLRSNKGWGEYNGVDNYNFTVRPSGYCRGNNCEGLYKQAFFWLNGASGLLMFDRQTSEVMFKLWGMNDLQNIGNGLEYYQYAGAYWLSVRCVQEENAGNVSKNSISNFERSSETKKFQKEMLEKKEGTLVDSRDGKTYKTIKLGNQEWMAEDLKYEMTGASFLRTVEDLKIGNLYDERDSVFALWLQDYLKNVMPDTVFPKLMEKFEDLQYSFSFKDVLLSRLFHVIDDNSYSKLLNYIMKEKKYGSCVEKNGICGLFYEFVAAKKACPEGWRLPKYDEWDALENKKVREYFSVDANSVYWSSTPWDESFEDYYVKFFSNKIHLFFSNKMNDFNTLKRVGETARVRCIRQNETDNDIDKVLAKKAEYFLNKKSETFETGTLNDSRDGKIYKTVKIGDQNWMAENLRYTGSSRYYNKKNIVTCYAEDDELCNILGPMYFLGTSSYDDDFLSEAGAACPNGWHIPSAGEWNSLAEKINSQNMNVAEELFVLLGGQKVYGKFSGIGEYAAFLTDTYRGTEPSKVRVYRDSIEMIKGDDYAYVRCVENKRNGTFKDSRDGIVYKTVKYGKTTWMAENLKYKSRNSFCFDDKKSNCDILGRLYTHSAAMRVCPAGWKLPSKDDFNSLPQGGGYSYMRLRAKDAWNVEKGPIRRIQFTSDAYSFSLLPAGRRDVGGRYIDGPNYMGFDKTYMGILPGTGLWTSSPDSKNTRDDDYFFYFNEKMEAESGSEFLGLSVRCVKK